MTEQLMEYAGNLATWTLQSGENLMTYLNILSHFPEEYTINNQLLIMGYNQDATYINGVNEWNNKGISVNQDAQPILIIEPSGGGFVEKYMYDVKDTDYDYSEPVYDKSAVLEALISSAGEIEIVDEMKAGVRAMYIPENDCIRVKRSNSTSFDGFFLAIATELYHKQMAKGSEGTYKRATHMLTSKAVAWTLGARYHMDVSEIPFSNLPERYKELSVKTCKKELEKIKTGFDGIAKSIDLSLSEIYKRREIQIER